jgi:hypothetical protein
MLLPHARNIFRYIKEGVQPKSKVLISKTYSRDVKVVSSKEALGYSFEIIFYGTE